MKKLKKLPGIFLIFFKIGAFTFGSGWSVLAQLEREYVVKRKEISKATLLEILTVGKSVPGIMITNVSMLMGMELAGPAGGVAAVIGLTLPAVIILSGVTYFYDFIKDNYWFAAAMKGVSAAVIAIVLSAALSLGEEAFKEKLAIIICAAAFLLGLFTGISNILMIAAGAVIALVWFGVEKAGEKK
jgi:chromate transporter